MIPGGREFFRWSPSFPGEVCGQEWPQDPGRADKYHMKPEKSPILDLEVPLIVQIASRSMLVKDVVGLEPGSIIEFPRSADQDLEILVNNKSVGLGSAVKVGENFGIRINAIKDLANCLD